MRLLILSDLHHELWREKAPQIDLTINRPDIVVLAGDISSGAKAVQWATDAFADTPVLYVSGNHEAYGKNLDDVQDDIEAACMGAPNVHFLNCSEYIHGSVRFIGATLWTDFKLFGDAARADAMHEAESAMTDYKRIRLARKGYRKLRAADTAQLHAAHKSWIKKRLAEPFAGSTVVITHMAPSMQSVPEQYRTDLSSAAYASQMDDVVSQADLWIHGHMHETLDYHVGKCRVVCNPCGYINRNGSPENVQFDPAFIVELPDA
ncbi:metallophosphoesterase [Duganella sp. FT94W]|uniref:Metallophosphoesterase n=1 Tax=Duganella lactea TaxID=2692173 RepID=A0ABW9VC68_9BURK|nr:metallophosphoesterase family protein [Duganella lactea]MYM36586.1 metallophosphoesterase [Duganella lactea]